MQISFRPAPIIVFFFVLSLFPLQAMSRVIESDTLWSGEISVEEDVIVPEGITLTLAPGTVLRIALSERTQTEPEFLSHRTEITVRGKLIADGKSDAPVTFQAANGEKSSWAGIIVDGGEAVLRSSLVRDAEAAVDVINGSAHISGSRLMNNRYGLSVQGSGAAVSIESSEVKGNDYGIMLFNSAKIESKDTIVRQNRKKDRFSQTAAEYHPILKTYKIPEMDVSREYGDEVILGELVLRGRITVNGIIRVPENSRLIITPGTIVEFSRKDTNNDGIGENGFLVQGHIIAKGTKDNPIIFRSAEKQKGMHDWDSINILGSDRAQNIIEYCQFENSYRGMHFHFANVVVKDSVLKNNARGIQFQESIVDINGTDFYDNKSALWARDSEVVFSGNNIYHNLSGINFFRNILTFRNNAILNNDKEGLRIREGIPLVEDNIIAGNRNGLMIVDSVYGTFRHNEISGNLESGIALRGPVNIEISENVLQKNGINGISIQDSSAVIKGNLIAENGERGVGILSFHGTITANNIINNGSYNLGVDGAADVAATMNWWGNMSPGDTIFDARVEAGLGRVSFEPFAEQPFTTWSPPESAGVQKR